MQKHNKKLIVLVTVLLLVIGTSFAYFVSRIILEGKGAKTDTELVTLGDTTIRVDGTLEFNDKDIYPGHKNISSVKITATGDRLVVYNLTWEGNNTLAGLNYKVYKTTEEQTPTITCVKKEVGTIRKELYEECEENLTSLGETISEGEIKAGEKLNIQLVMNESIQATNEGIKVYYYVVIEYPNIDDSQNIDMNGTFTGKVHIKTMKSSANCGSACKSILVDNTIRSEEIDYTVANGYYTYQGEQFSNYCTYNHGHSYSMGEMDRVFGIPKDIELYKFKMYNGEIFSGLADGTFLENGLGKGTWSGGKCTFNGKEVGKITSWYKPIDNENDCNNIYKSNLTGHEYVSFYEYEYIGKASETLEHTHGLFEGEDDDGTTFYFRGDVDNNYVKFGKWNDVLPDVYIGYDSDEINDDYILFSSKEECENHSQYSGYSKGCTLMNDTRAGKDMYWRIVKINGDGSIRMVYDGTASYNNGQEHGDRGLGFSEFNSKKDDNAYVGYMYGKVTSNYIDLGRSKNISDIYLSSSSNYYYGTEYTFNKENGHYSLSGTIVNGTWNEANSANFINKYTCKSTSSDGTCFELYFVSEYSKPEHANGYTYNSESTDNNTYEETHANINDSTIKQYVDNWYQKNFSNTSFENYIDTNAGFCGDRSIISGTGIGRDLTSYRGGNLAFNGQYENEATYKCNNNDLYTTSLSNKGNKALKYPVGLISADEAVFAGFGYYNNRNYLYTGQYYFASAASSGGTYFCILNLSPSSGINTCGMGTPTTRPVINLKANVKLSGSGTATDPYVVTGLN